MPSALSASPLSPPLPSSALSRPSTPLLLLLARPRTPVGAHSVASIRCSRPRTPTRGHRPTRRQRRPRVSEGGSDTWVRERVICEWCENKCGKMSVREWRYFACQTRVPRRGLTQTQTQYRDLKDNDEAVCFTRALSKHKISPFHALFPLLPLPLCLGTLTHTHRRCHGTARLVGIVRFGVTVPIRRRPHHHRSHHQQHLGHRCLYV